MTRDLSEDWETVRMELLRDEIASLEQAQALLSKVQGSAEKTPQLAFAPDAGDTVRVELGLEEVSRVLDEVVRGKRWRLQNLERGLRTVTSAQ